MGGFPHSEIVGSKFAHNSPTLIAACHVLHRLYMPRHPRIALTSRLRVHTTNDNAGSACPRAGAIRNSAEQRSHSILVRMILSQPDKNADRVETRSRAFLFVSAPVRIVRPKPIIANRSRHGIDFKNPFTMSKVGRRGPYRSLRRGSRVFIPGNLW